MTMAKYDDAYVTRKLARGAPLTSEDIELLLDDNSADNIVKRLYQDLLFNEELQDYTEHRLMNKGDLLAALEKLREDEQWWEEWQDQLKKELSTSQQLSQEIENNNIIIQEPAERQDVDSLTTLLDTLLLTNKLDQATHHKLKSKLSQPNEDINLIALQTVIHLCSKNQCVRDFIFDNLNNVDPVQQIFHRFAHVSKMIEHTPNAIENFMQNIIKLDFDDSPKVSSRIRR